MSQKRQTRHDQAISPGEKPRLATFGGCRLEVPGTALPPGLGAGRPLALLTYLAAHRDHAVSRDELADLLWGDRPLRDARRVLRQGLYVIRKTLGPSSLITTRGGIHLGDCLRVDLYEFEERVRAGDAEGALEMAHGPFLAGFEIPGATAFQQWVDAERARIGSLVREATLVTVQGHVERGEWDAALRLTEQYLTQDPDDAEVLCRKADILDKAGRTLEALALARDVLRDAVAQGEWPHLSGATRATLERLTATRDAPQGPDRQRTDEEDGGLLPPSFTGRGDEYRLLVQQWTAAQRGEGRVVLVVGDPGVGKTRLVEEVLRHAASEGATVLRGKSYELEDGLLFGALVDVMAQALKAPGFAGVSDIWLAELSRLLPELVEQYPQLAHTAEGEANAGRRRFHEAVAQVLEALAYEAPVVCLLDDLHWADDATLELVHYLGRRLCATPVLFLVSLRPREASDTLRRLQHSLVAEHGGLSIELEPLGRSSTSTLIASMGHGNVAPPKADQAVWDASGGNPFLAVSTVRALVEAGALSVTRDGWIQHDEDRDDGTGRVFPEAWELIKGRLGGLPERTREILELAAIIGRSFTADILSKASAEDPSSALVHLEALEAKRILKADRTNGVVHFDFAHDRIREAVYEGIDPEQRVLLHSRVAQALAGEAGLGACLMARHFHQAGRKSEAYHHALVGAEWARGVFAYGGELEMLELARANAPDQDSVRSLDDRLTGVRGAASEPSRARPPRPHRSGARSWYVGLPTLVSLALIVGWMMVEGSGTAAPADTLPAPLPPGLLVMTQDEMGRHFAVIDPENPHRVPGVLDAGQLSVPPEADLGRLLLSPDGEFEAFTIQESAPPDIWIQRRDGTGLRQLTTHPEDDVVEAWLVDGSGVLMRTMRDRGGATYGYSLAVVPVDGGPVRMITRGPWSERTAALSPDGSRIAVVRELGGASLWIMNLDGSDAQVVLSQVGEIGHLAWSPRGDVLSYAESSQEGRRLSVLDLTELVPRPRVLATGISEAIWDRDGEKLFYTARADGNAEIFSVSVAGGDATRVTHSPQSETLLGWVGPPRPYPDAVEVVRSSEARDITLLTDDSVRVTTVVWASDGTEYRATPRLRCLDRAVCHVTPNGNLHALVAGRTSLVADLGGWRADTVRVEVMNGEPRRVVSEDWEDGIDPQTWRAFGEPSSIVEAGVGRSGSKGFIANGDAKFDSGVVLTTPIAWHAGVTVEWWAAGAFDTPWPSFQGWSVLLADAPPQSLAGDVALREILAVAAGNGGPGRKTRLRFGNRVLSEGPEWSPSTWSHYTLQLLPDTRCELWIDDVRQFKSECTTPAADSVWLILSGRATKGPVVHDDITVWTGVKLR